jgi:hypothetical protein
MANHLIELIFSGIICLFSGGMFINVAQYWNSTPQTYELFVGLGAMLVIIGLLLLLLSGLAINSKFSKMTKQ